MFVLKKFTRILGIDIVSLQAKFYFLKLMSILATKLDSKDFFVRPP